MLDNDLWDSEEYSFAPVTCEQRLAMCIFFYHNPELEANTLSHSLENHSSYYEPSDHSSDLNQVWLFDQLPYTSYHSEDNSTASSVPLSPAPSVLLIQSPVN